MSAATRDYHVTEVQNINYGCRYIIRDYGDYRTISKMCKINGVWDTASRVDEYVIWRKELAGNLP